MTSEEKTKVVLLACGSFNPITNMHLRMFELARDHLEDTGRYRVVKGIISPVGDGYKKKALIEACYRLKMARLATEDSDWITVDDWECNQSDWIPTVKVIRHHHKKLDSNENNNDDVDTVKRRKRRKLEINENACQSSCVDTNADTLELKLLCGADVLEYFDDPNIWKPDHIKDIVGRFGVVCITRCGTDPEKYINQSDLLYRYRKNIHVVREWVTNEISATHVRRAMRRGRSVRYLLPDPVINYILENNLYTEESEQRNADVMLAPYERNKSPN